MSRLYASLWPRYQAWLGSYPRLSPASQALYGRQIECFLRYGDASGLHSLNDVTPATLAQFLAPPLGRAAYSASWQRGRLSSLHLFFRWAYEARYCAVQPMVRYRREKIVHHPLTLGPSPPPDGGVALTKAQVHRFVQSVSGGIPTGRHAEISVRNRSLLLLLLDTGLHAETVRTATFQAWDGAHHRLHVCTARGEQLSIMLQAPACRAALHDWLTVRARWLGAGLMTSSLLYATHRGTPLTPRGLYALVAQALQHAGIEIQPTGPTVLRHTALRQRLDQGVPLEQLRADFDIHTLATLERYRSPPSSPLD